MDPYIERADIWPDFHDSFVTGIRAALQPQLRPRYAALVQDRLYVVESERPIWPDVSIVRASDASSGGAAVAVAQPDAPAVFELARDEFREPLVHIVEASTGQIVTAIEVLSPDNKKPGAGRTSYLQKREELWAAGTNLVEIDLLRDGEPTVRISSKKLDSLRPWSYLVTVTRCWPSRQEVYAWPLARRLPRISVPLAADDHDVLLDLQSVFARCWDEGPYPQLLRYNGAPPGSLSPADLSWSERQLLDAGIRAATGPN
jgi:hypothetical protein